MQGFKKRLTLLSSFKISHINLFKLFDLFPYFQIGIAIPHPICDLSTNSIQIQQLSWIVKDILSSKLNATTLLFIKATWIIPHQTLEWALLLPWVLRFDADLETQKHVNIGTAGLHACSALAKYLYVYICILM